MNAAQSVRKYYFDNAATSWPKPACVADAMSRHLTEGVSAGRGVYSRSMDSNAVVKRCRMRLARLVGASNFDQIVFAHNGTHALNIAIQGFLKSADHVVSTCTEHNSVLRSLQHMKQSREVGYTLVPCDAFGYVDPSDIRNAITDRTRLVVVSHASNVTGAIQDIQRIGEIVERSDARLLVDAAQTIGHHPIDVTAMGIDLLAGSGHKGCMGPLGTGFLYFKDDLVLEPLVFGGTGSSSFDLTMPPAGPSRHEAGNLNVPALAGLEAALAWLDESPATDCGQHARAFSKAVSKLPGVRVWLDPERDVTDVVSLHVDGYDPSDVASILDAEFGVEVRAGLHCAPLIHEAIGAGPSGTIRFSFGRFTSNDDIEVAINAIGQVAVMEV